MATGYERTLPKHLPEAAGWITALEIIARIGWKAVLAVERPCKRIAGTSDQELAE
jgi:hypothetical protein